MKSITYNFKVLFIFFLVCGLSSYYAQTITTTSVNSTVICRGGLINVSFVTNGYFQAGSYFKIQLSNASGVFSGNYIGELELQNATTSNSIVSRTISGEIQSSIAPGNGYKVRVVHFVHSNTPTVIGTTNSSTISIVASQVTPSFSLPTSICSGTALILPTTSTNGVVGTWSPAINNQQTTTYTFTPNSNYCSTTKTGTVVVNPSITFDTTVASCQSYTWPVNGQTYTASGNYSYVTGCTERILHLTIFQNTLSIPVFSSVVQTGVCLNGITNPTYSILPVSGATSYEWTVPTGTTIISGQGTTSITLNVSGNFTSGMLSVKAINPCAASIERIISIFSTPPTPGLMSGITTGLCAQGVSSSDYSIASVSGATDYLWTIPAGTEVISGQGTNALVLNFTSSFSSGNLSIEARNACGSSIKRTISLSSIPLTVGLITGATTGLCSQGQSTSTYSIASVSGATDYLWTIPAGAEIVSGQGTNAIVLSFTSSFTSGTLSVEARNACGSSTKRTITLYSIPLAPGLITGATTGLCSQGQSTSTYSIANVSGATDYLWTIPAGAEIVSGQGTNTIVLSFTPSFTTGTLSVEARNACGSSTKRTITLYSIPLAPGLITGATTGLCSQGQSTSTYSIASVSGATDYLWTIPAGAEIVSGQGTTSITLNFTASFISGSLSVEARNACGSSIKRTITLNSITSTPGVISGISVGLGINGIPTATFSTTNVVGATDYVWTIPTGTTIVSGEGTNTITLSFTSIFISGSLSVIARNACGSSPARTLSLYSVPLTPGTITGTSTGLCSQGVSTATYSIAAVNGASSYTWIAPAGTTIVSGQGTTSIVLSFSNTFSLGLLCVCANNVCGSSAIKTLTLNSVPLIPGAITGTTNNLCPNGVNTPTYTIAAVTGATSYTWTAPAGTTIISGQGTTSVTLSISESFTLGVLQVVANNGCGSSVVRSLTLNSTPSTPWSITGSTAPCGTTTYTCATVAQAVSYIWTVPAGLEIASGQGTNSITVNVISSTVSGSITVKASNNCKTGLAKSMLVTSCTAKSMLTATEETATNVIESKVEAVVYPNPTSGEVNIEFTNELEENATVELYDMIGNKVSRVGIEAGSATGNLTLEVMTSGIYLLQVVNSNNDIIYKAKVSKQ